MLNAMTIKHSLILITLLTIHFSSFGQTYSNLMTDDEIHYFLKQTIKSRNTDSEILSWNKCDLFKDLNNCYKGEFLQKDNENFINDTLLIEFQKKYESIENKGASHFQIFREKKNRKKYSRVSIPLISNDRKTAIIKIMAWCGNECGSGGILIYIRQKGKWKKIDFRCTWVN